jgi:hypothetical protein
LRGMPRGTKPDLIDARPYSIVGADNNIREEDPLWPLIAVI